VRRRLLAIISPLDQKPFEGDLQGNINIAPSVEKAWFTSHSLWLLHGVLRGAAEDELGVSASRRGGRRARGDMDGFDGCVALCRAELCDECGLHGKCVGSARIS
jgi:hypothetical protein